MFPHPIVRADRHASTLKAPASGRSPIAILLVGAISLGAWGSLVRFLDLI